MQRVQVWISGAASGEERLYNFRGQEEEPSGLLIGGGWLLDGELPGLVPGQHGEGLSCVAELPPAHDPDEVRDESHEPMVTAGVLLAAAGGGAQEQGGQARGGSPPAECCSLRRVGAVVVPQEEFDDDDPSSDSTSESLEASECPRRCGLRRGGTRILKPAHHLGNYVGQPRGF